MMSCGGTSSACWRRSTLTILCTGPKTKMIPGPLALARRWPKVKITARSYSRRILMELRAHKRSMTKGTITTRDPPTKPPGISDWVRSDSMALRKAHKAKKSSVRWSQHYRLRRRVNLQHKILHLAYHDRLADFDAGGRHRIPKRAVQQNLAGGRQPRGHHSDLADKPLLSSHDFAATSAYCNRHQEGGDQPQGNGDRKRGPQLHPELGNGSIHQQKHAHDQHEDAAGCEDAMALHLGLESEQAEGAYQ